MVVRGGEEGRFFCSIEFSVFFFLFDPSKFLFFFSDYDGGGYGGVGGCSSDVKRRKRKKKDKGKLFKLKLF